VELKAHFLCKYKTSLNQFFCKNIWGIQKLWHIKAQREREENSSDEKDQSSKQRFYMAEHKHSWFQYTCMEISWVSWNCTCSCLFSFQTSSVAPLSLLDSIPAQLTHTGLLLLNISSSCRYARSSLCCHQPLTNNKCKAPLLRVSRNHPLETSLTLHVGHMRGTIYRERIQR
jgi:hypothetical protein